MGKSLYFFYLLKEGKMDLSEAIIPLYLVLKSKMLGVQLNSTQIQLQRLIQESS